MNIIETIKNSINEKFNNCLLFVDHSPDFSHIQLQVITDDFINMPLLKQHRGVMHLLKSHLKEEIHAVHIKTFTKSQWQKINNTL